jgi:hypothetical protein
MDEERPWSPPSADEDDGGAGQPELREAPPSPEKLREVLDGPANGPLSNRLLTTQVEPVEKASVSSPAGAPPPVNDSTGSCYSLLSTACPGD